MIKEIKFTDKAIKQINSLLSKKDEGSFFRIAIKGGGCSGYQYEFTFDKKLTSNDLKYQILKANHLVVVVFLFLFNDYYIVEC